ncbi:glycosyltransferase family 4 protein [Clostridium carnis]
MKILFLNKYFYVKGGSETYFFKLRNELMSRGHKIIDFSMKDEKNLYSPWEKYFVDNVDYSNNSKKVKNAIKLIYSKEAYNKLCKLIEIEKPDVAHINLVYHQLSLSVIHALKKYNIPIVYVSHDYKIICPNYKTYSNGICNKCYNGKFYNCIKERCHKNSLFNSTLVTVEAYMNKIIKSYKAIDTIICPSYFVENELIKAGIEKSKIKTMQNFLTIDIKDIDVKVNKEKQVLYYGRLSEEKGIIQFLKSVKYIHPDISVKIIGTGPQEEEILKYIRDNNLLNVRLMGFKSGKSLYEEIARSRCTIIPSVWNETFGLTVIESMALGTPVLGSCLGGIKENIVDGINGYCFDPTNIEEISTSINKIFNLDDTSYREMSNNCVKHAGKFSLVEYCDNLMEIYTKLVNDKKE